VLILISGMKKLSWSKLLDNKNILQEISLLITRGEFWGCDVYEAGMVMTRWTDADDGSTAVELPLQDPQTRLHHLCSVCSK
jgi:hypothetical protein